MSQVATVVKMEPTEATTVRMAIQHALVARGSTVAAEFSVAPTHARAIAHQILDKIPAATGDGDSHFCYAYDRFVYHVKRTSDMGGLTVLCMVDETVERMIAYAFLQDIHTKFLVAYGNQDLDMNDEFSRVLSQQMDYYSNTPNADGIQRVLAQLKEIRLVLMENIEKILERGEKLEVLVQKARCIRDQNFKFEKQARRLKSTGWWRIFLPGRIMLNDIINNWTNF